MVFFKNQEKSSGEGLFGTPSFKTYFTVVLYIVAFCQLFIKDMMDGWMDGWMDSSHLTPAREVSLKFDGTDGTEKNDIYGRWDGKNMIKQTTATFLKQKCEN